MIWEIAQTAFMLGTLATVMVNTASIRRLTRRLEYVESRIGTRRRG